MTTADALLDSNVIVAALAVAHEHHAASVALFNAPDPADFAVAAHSFAEVFSTLTRSSGLPQSRFSPAEASAALLSLRSVVQLVGLTPAQTFDAIQSFGAQGGMGPRLYDALIGQCAAVHGIGAIVTWNTRHMAGLFSQLAVITPAAFLASQRPTRPARPRG